MARTTEIIMHDISREVARQMLAAYLTWGGMFIVGMLLLIVFPVGFNGCGGKLIVPCLLFVILSLSLQEVKDLDRFVMQTRWPLAHGALLVLRRLCESVALLALNVGILAGWLVLIEKLDKIYERRRGNAASSS